MALERISIENRDQWLAARRLDVTASDAAALFGRHEYTTPFQLYVDKTTIQTSEDTGLFRRGRWFEQAALVAARETHPSWTIDQGTTYLRDTENRLGATPDFIFKDPDAGRIGLIQAKTVNPKVFESKWLEDNSPPGWIVLQLNTELGLSGMTEGLVGALVMDMNNPLYEEFPVTFNPDAFAATQKASREFWDMVASKVEPTPDYRRDHDAIVALYGRETWDMVNWTDEDYLEDLCSMKLDLQDRVRTARSEIKEIDAELRHRLGTADEALMEKFDVTCRTVVREASFQAGGSSRVLRVTRKKETL